MILKVEKVLKLLKDHKLRLLCCQRIVRSFVETIYSDTVFRMILLSLRCTKGVYPCWETLGVKASHLATLQKGNIIFSQNYSNQRQTTQANFDCQ